MPSEPSLFLFMLLKDLVGAPWIKRLTTIVFDSDYLLTVEQLKKVITGGSVSPQFERLRPLKLEYLGCNYDIRDKLELRQWVERRYPSRIRGFRKPQF